MLITLIMFPTIDLMTLQISQNGVSKSHQLSITALVLLLILPVFDSAAIVIGMRRNEWRMFAWYHVCWYFVAYSYQKLGVISLPFHFSITRPSNENILRYSPFVRGIHRSPVESPHKRTKRGPLTFLCYQYKQSTEQTPVIRDDMTVIWRRHNAVTMQ